MKFITVAQAFEKIDKISSRLAITEILADVLKQTTPEQARQLCYLSLGCLNPPYIGTQFAIAQKSMIKIVARVIGMSEKEVELQVQTLGDVGSVLEKYSWQASQELSIQDVYSALLEIEKIHGTGSQEEKALKVYELVHELDPISAKFVIRIILGKLRLGFSDMTLVDALSWMEVGDKSIRKNLEHAYNICADIGFIAYELKQNGVDVINDMNIHVGVPIRPAAADRLPSAQAIVDKLGPCVVQPKLDGFRLQVHIDLTQQEPLIRFFSRNLIDMSSMFPEFVQACKKLPIKTIILDAEAIVYDPNTGMFLSFQETVKRKRKYGIDELASELPLQLNIFDIMYLNGQSLLDSTQVERRKKLKNALDGSVDKTIIIIDEKYVSTGKELEDYFIREIAAGLEGVVVKKPDSLYQAGKRSSNWIKLKYQAAEKLNDTLDVVILGYYPGKGKRATFGIGAFLVGIHNELTDKFETVAKIGTGLSDEAWVDLKKRCDAIAVKEQPKNVNCPKELVPLVWVSPELVCEVLADEITFSPLHTAGKTDDVLGFAFRFPRFLKYRTDKLSYQTTSLDELKRFQQRK
ncbi:MAG: DNA ligase-1 [Alteromonas naphthalenivorans]|jgi:DNA ligase-1